VTEKIIYKWGPVGFGPIPIRGRVIHVGLQEGDIFIWTENQIVTGCRHPERMVRLHPTGQKYTGHYHGTVIMPSGMVWHVIEDDGP
jgi:hypothetical protein